MKTFSEDEVTFICRAKQNWKFELLENRILEGQDRDMGESILLRDCIVRLYTGMPIQNYRRRWDIEFFFRFLKQELNASYLASLNKNGLQVMLYITIITSILILIYKKENKQGYKTVKRRFAMDVRDLAIAMVVVQCGGVPELFFKT